MDTEELPKETCFSVDKFWNWAGRLYRVGCLAGGLGCIAFNVWLGQELYNNRSQLLPDGETATRTGISSPTPSLTPDASATEIPISSPTEPPPEATIDVLATSISQLRATDTARTEADFENDLNSLPTSARVSSVKLELFNSNSGANCSGIVGQVMPHPNDLNQDIVVVYTAGHCVWDESFSRFSSVRISQPQFPNTQGLDISAPNMGSDSYGEFGAIAFAVPHGSFTVPAVSQVAADHTFTTGEELYALSFNPYVRDRGFPGEYRVLSPVLEMGFSASRLGVTGGITVEGPAAPGSSGAGVVDQNGQLVGIIASSAEYENQSATAVFPIPTNSNIAIDTAVKRLLDSQELLP